MSAPWWELEQTAAAVLAAAGRQVVYATVLFLLVLPVNAWLLRSWPRRAAPLRSALWGLVLLRLVLPPDLALPGSLGDLRSRLGAAFEAASPAGPAAEPMAGAPRRAEGSAAAQKTLPWALTLLGLWGMGAAANGAAWWRRRRAAGRVAAGGRPVDDPEVVASAADWRRRLGVRRPVRLVAVEGAVAPYTIGTRSPLVVLPRALLERREPWLATSAVAHELAHVRRRDDLRLMLLQALRAIWFFYPVAGWVERRLADERERLVDAAVLARGVIPPGAYGRSLLTASRLAFGNPDRGERACAPALLSTQRRLSMRIHEIVREGATPAPRPAFALVPALIAGLFLLPMAPLPAGGAAAVPAEAAAVRPVDLPVWNDPVPGARMTSAYGKRVDPIDGEARMHLGVDLAAPRGTPVVAPAAGTVRTATTTYEGGARYGTVVIVDHSDGLSSFYCHLERFDVVAGQRVGAGEAVGTVGSTGVSTGAHLHFEVWRDGARVDPASLVAVLRR